MAGIGKFTFNWFKNLRIKSALEKQNITSELAFLKSQINPHFLFNTLNNIHTLAYKKEEGVAEAIMKLSELMRYMIYDSNEDLMPMNLETEYLKSFIDLQELRFKTKGIVDFQISGNIDAVLLAPLILLAFVENAFKHSDRVDRQGAIVVKLSLGNQIEFSVTNACSASRSAEQRDGVGGIGLENIKRRLELIYRNQFELNIDQVKHEFSVNLIIEKL
ncbi:MAG: two-component system LytT family sensor kinase [Roseivirga sp.]|jgi:two-component system LytT family sensor kinase